MSAVEIANKVFWIGVQDPDLRIFDVVMTTEYGTSYNAYLIKGSEKTALIETVKIKYWDEYLQRLQQVVDLSAIDFLVVNHTEPDHSGSIEALLDKIPGLTVVGSPTALGFLKNIANRDFKSRAVDSGDKLSLGDRTLRFINAPFLHWPDSMFTYLEEDGILFPCDFLGSHFSSEQLFDDQIESDYSDAFKYYFDMIMGPFKPYVLEALEKIKDLNLNMVCPGHGPILRSNIAKHIELYRQWATPAPMDDNKPRVVVAYVSAYGYTEALANSIIDGIVASGDFNIQKHDLVYADLQEVLKAIDHADGLLFGSPTINGDALPPIWQLLIQLSPITHADKVAAAFGAFGWSGEAVPSIEARLNSLRMKVIPGLRVKFKPTASDLDKAFQLGVDFAKSIQQKMQDTSKLKWRCLVCGHIHIGAEPPAICPACGVGKENFELMEIETVFSQDTQEKFVIIGGGIAALSAAQAIRERNKTASITMLTEEPVLPYYRPALSDYLGEALSAERLFPYNLSWYRDNRIEVKTEKRAVRLDTSSRQVETVDGTIHSYDKLIIATGARSNVPPIKGADYPGVFTLRSLEDARRLKEALNESRKAVVIGGGVLGLEAVEEMAAMGLEVAVVEFNDRLMPRQLDPEGSSRLQALMKARGIALYLGVSTEEIIGAGKVQGVRLSNGETLAADLVLLSTGVKPNVELAREAGLGVGQGIIVDNQMRTSVAEIYAAGDVAQFGERVVGLWPVSMEMGRAAGAAAAGDWIEYRQPLISTMLAAFGREIFSLGEVNLPAEQVRTVIVNDPAQEYFKKSFLKDGVLVGEIIIAPRVDTSESMQKLGRNESGQKVHNKWKCRICGYIHEGPEPPETCPVCGAAREEFDPID